ncbi:unnamed protein product [Allacma fusca]|uniref:DUF7656 domain-containing protein n=1 Tax=Allacma fusca TaxID=39272 RepID=A0A8J2JQW1_9HEXA|nr:unnamed protein product [Allacma fusca]
MKNFWTHILLFEILVNFSPRANGDTSIQRTTRVPTTSKTDKVPQECFGNTFQDNFQNGIYQLIEFIQTTNSTLTKLLDKLDSHSQQIKNLESQIENLKSERDTEVNELLFSLSSKLNGLERTQNVIQNSMSSQAVTISSLQSSNSKITSTLFKRNPEDFLPSPINGASFNGSTFEGVLATVPTDNMLVVQIKNYMDVDLTGYQLYLPDGFTLALAPNNISARTAEVATFLANQKKARAARPEISYQIGGTDISLHVYVVGTRTVKTFAAALLPKSAPAKSIISDDCTDYNHTGTVGSYKCVTKVGVDTAKTLTVYEGDIFLKVTFETKSYPGPGALTFTIKLWRPKGKLKHGEQILTGMLIVSQRARKKSLKICEEVLKWLKELKSAIDEKNPRKAFQIFTNLTRQFKLSKSVVLADLDELAWTMEKIKMLKDGKRQQIGYSGRTTIDFQKQSSDSTTYVFHIKKDFKSQVALWWENFFLFQSLSRYNETQSKLHFLDCDIGGSTCREVNRPVKGENVENNLEDSIRNLDDWTKTSEMSMDNIAIELEVKYNASLNHMDRIVDKYCKESTKHNSYQKG